MDEHHRHGVEHKKPGTKEYILPNSMPMKLTDAKIICNDGSQNSSDFFIGRVNRQRKGRTGGFWGEGIILYSTFYYYLYSVSLYFDQGGGYKSVSYVKLIELYT